MSEPDQQCDWASLAERVDWAAPSLTRMQAYPELTTNRQTYDATTEIRQWSMPKAAQFLATLRFKV